MPRKYAKPQEIMNLYRKPEQVEQYAKKWGDFEHLARNRRQANIVNGFIRKVSLRVVLDVGIGPGRLVSQLKGIKQGIGLDSSRKMLNLARNKLGRNWRIIVGDAFSLPVKKGSIDLLISTKLVRHLDKNERVAALKSFRDALKDNGFLVIDALNQRALFKPEEEVQKKIKSTYWIKKDLIKELQENGFKVITVKPVFNYYFAKRFALTYKGTRLRKIMSFLVDFSERFGDINSMEWLLLCQKM